MGALAILVVTCTRQQQAIAPDFEVDFSCRRPPSEDAAEAFSRGNGFVTFNEERARRQHERKFFPLQIDSYNSRRSILDFIGLQEPPSRGRQIHYRLTILSPPPTVHDRKLEGEALDFVRNTLQCRVEFSEAHENGRESGAMFERIFAEEQHRIARLHSCIGRLDSACSH